MHHVNLGSFSIYFGKAASKKYDSRKQLLDSKIAASKKKIVETNCLTVIFSAYSVRIYQSQQA